jgi:AmmeMemoRadiSam system protein B
VETVKREPAVAGLFYPGKKKELEQLVHDFLAGKKNALKGELKALLVPHAGYVYSGGTAGKAFRLLKKLNQRREWEIMLLGPSHTMGFEGVSLSEAETWKTPLGTVPVSKRARQFLSPVIRPFEAAHEQEHCLEVQLPFLQETLSRFSIIPLVTGYCEPEILAIELENKLAKNVLLIASSDLSHYFPYEKAVEKDRKTIQAILTGDIPAMEEKGEACGKTAILTVMRLAQKKNWKAVLLEYKNSGDTAGTKEKVVGYASIAFTEQRPSSETKKKTGKKQA